MSTYLLDVNVLITLHSPTYDGFHAVRHWFLTKAIHSFATCAVTEAGFIRVSTQISAEANVGMEEAKIALTGLKQQSGHTFWPMAIGYLEAANSFGQYLRTHRQITDAYLLGTAIHHKGKLATLDRGVLHLAGPKFAEHVELIP